jgi:hypothetical protein
LGFAQHAGAAFSSQLGVGHYFYCHFPLQGFIVGAVDRAHAALAYFFIYPITLVESGPDQSVFLY